MLSLAVCLLFPLQETFQKAMMPLTEWALQCGMDVVNAVRKLEEKGTRVTAASFKITEGFRDPADYRELVSVLLNESTKCNLSSMRSVAKGILNRRWWHWLLMHPELKEDRIHGSRSMFPVHPVAHTHLRLDERHL